MKKILIITMVLSSLGLFAQNLINNPGFEEGNYKWVTAGADFDITDETLAGDSAAMLTVTNQKYNGIRPNITKIELVPGVYMASFWAKAANATTAGKKASVKVESTVGSGLAESASSVLSETEWVQVKKEFTVTTTDSVKFMVRANNVDALGMVMYADNVELVQKEENVLDGSFDIDPITLNWTKLGAATIHSTYHTDSVYSGLNACVFTANAADDGFKNKTDFPLEDGAGSYLLSAWIKGTAGENCQLRAKVINSGNTSYQFADYVIIETGAWEKIELPISMTDANGTIGPMFRQRTFDTPTAFAIDDFKMEKQIPTSIVNTPKVSLELYPNPASNTINLRGIEFGTAFEIYGISGNKVLQSNYQSRGIDVSQLSQGIYYIKTTNNVASFIKK